MVNETATKQAKGIDGTLRVFEAFAGYGSQRMALKNLGIKHEVVATSEVDEYAILSYGAIHGSNLDKELPESEEVIKEYLTKLNVPLTDKGKLKNLRGKGLRRFYNALEQSNGLGDISKIDVKDIPDHDLFTYSFPCQDISTAGNQKGFSKDSGTRSGLLWESERIIKAKKPKYLLMENVKNLISKKFMPGFLEWISALEELGYSNYWEVLNAKDFGIPQNRERVFMVSILGGHEPYVFPKPIKLEKRLKDVLEDEVDENYYLDDERAQQLIATITDVKDIEQQEGLKMNRNEVSGKSDIAQTLLARDYKGFGNQDMNGVIEPEIKQVGNTTPNPKRENPQTGRTYDPSGISPTLTTMQGGNLQPQIIEPERILGIFDKENSTHQSGSVYNKDKIAPTLDTMQGGWRQPSIIDEPNNDDVKPINPLKGKTNYGWHFEQEVYDNKGISRALKAGGGSGNIPKTLIAKEEFGRMGEQAVRTQNKLRLPHGETLNPWNEEQSSVDGVAPTLTTRPEGFKTAVLPVVEGLPIKNNTEQGYLIAKEGDGVDLAYPTSNTRRGRVQESMSQTLTTDDSKGVVEQIDKNNVKGTLYANASERFQRGIYPLSRTLKASNNDVSVTDGYRIRKLTPLECFRLMGVTDEDFYKAQAVNSNSQLYKQAGNSIVVAVLEAIFRNMFLEVPDEDLVGEQVTLF